MAIGGNRIPIDVRAVGGKQEVTYRLTFANTDTGAFDVVIGELTRVEFAEAEAEVQAQNGGRVLSAILKAGTPNTVTVSIHNGGGTQAPTAVLLKVVGI